MNIPLKVEARPVAVGEQPDDRRIAVQQDNPKRAGSKSFARYERYKKANTGGEFYRLGGTKGDLKNDSDPNRGYIIFI